MIGTNRPSQQRFPASCRRLLWVAALATACSGSGGGSRPPAGGPQLISAAFLGSGPAPQAGETLVLAFATDVSLAPGVLLDDADAELSGGGTLGAVTAPPTQIGPRSISIPLGAGVDFSPGTTTIVLRTTNDAVRDSAGRTGTRGAAVPISIGDGIAPVLARITIAAVDDELNGNGPAGGTLQLPPNGFTIDLAYSDNVAIDTSRTRITASVAVTTPGGSQAAGTNLQPFLQAVAVSQTSASYRVPNNIAFATGDCSITATVIDASGLTSTPGSFACRVRSFTNSLRPFETISNPSQVWYLDFDRDIESFTTTAISGGVSVDVVAGANGRSDFEDALHVVGLLAATPLANVSGSLDSNQVVLQQYKSRLLTELGELFAGANITFTLTKPPGSFGSNFSIPYNSFGYSQISIAGASNIQGVLGVAIFDPFNATQNDNTRTNFQGTRLGVFLHTMVDLGMGPPASSLFRQTFGPLAPSLGGTAVGNNNQDGQRLLGSLQDSRTNIIRTAIDDLARFIAIVLAHECGHSMGLVQNGAMPVGLYGNDTANFPGSADGHIRNTSLFPSGAINVMTPSLSYTGALNAASAFNSLNLAYLREQVFYGN